MKQIAPILLMFLLLGSCSNQAKQNQVFECLLDDSDSSSRTQQYYEIVGNSETDQVSHYDVYYFYHLKYPLTQEDHELNSKTRSELFNNIKGITYELDAQRYGVFEHIHVDYTEADFNELFEKQLIQSPTNQVPNYVSLEMMLKDLGNCQEMTQRSNSYQEQLIVGLSEKFDANSLNEDLFEPIDLSISDALECNFSDPSNSGFASSVIFEYDKTNSKVTKESLSDRYPISTDDYKEQLDQQKSIFNQIDGVTLDYKIDEEQRVYYVDLVIDYTKSNLSQLLELQLISSDSYPLIEDMLVLYDRSPSWTCDVIKP